MLPDAGAIMQTVARVVVTGAAGFIGSHLCDRLLAQGDEVIGVDSFDDFYGRAPKEANLEEARRRGGFRLIEGDVRERRVMDDALRAADCLVHLAARPGVRPSFDMPALVVDMNVRGSAVVLEAAAAANVTRVVLGSSSSVYGEGAETPFREDAPLGRAASPYAATKVAAEELWRLFAPRFEHAVVLRFFTVYGPRQRPDLAIHRFARLMLSGETLPVFGNTDSFRDYTYVSDIIDGICGALGHDAGWDVFNLGSGNPVTLGDLIASVEKAFGMTAHLRRLPPQRGDLRGTWASIDHARTQLGYRPRWSLEEGLDEFARWVRALRS